jgi:hypothetical protein
MKYELAKELKEAGFPNSELWFDDGRTIWGGTDMEPSAPTLEELIEACGNDIDHLVQKRGYPSEGRWWAVSHTVEDANGNNPEACGSIPEEAVARLWLFLQKSNERTAPKL